MNDFQQGAIEYFANPRNRLKKLKRSELYLDRLFDIKLSLSDKIKLKHEVSLAIEEYIRNSDPDKCQEPYKLATVNFLLKSYPQLSPNLEGIVWCVVSLKRNEGLNTKIHDLRVREGYQL